MPTRPSPGANNLASLIETLTEQPAQRSRFRRELAADPVGYTAELLGVPGAAICMTSKELQAASDALLDLLEKNDGAGGTADVTVTGQSATVARSATSKKPVGFELRTATGSLTVRGDPGGGAAIITVE